MKSRGLARRQPRLEGPAPAIQKSQTEPERLAFVGRFLREPLVHFLLAGTLVFMMYGLAKPATTRTDRTNKIVMTKDDLRQLAMQWLAQGRTTPTVDQMRTLVEQKVREEILSREAVALGLDKGDEILKRRLAQKMDFLAADVAALQNPGQTELRAWFAQNSDRFMLSPRASFRHLYFSFDRPDSRQRAAAALDKIVGEQAEATKGPIADAFMFQDYYAERTPDQVAKEFGPAFAKTLFELKAGGWQGPIQSGYGWHLVLIDVIEPGRTPGFEEVEPDVKSAWLDQKQREIKRLAFEAMRARYTVVVPPIEDADWQNLQKSQAPIASINVLPQ